MNAGVTGHCRVSFDSLAVKTVATKLLSTCDDDYELLSRWFGGIELPDKPVAVLISGYAPSFRSAPKAGVAISPGRLAPPTRVRYLFACDLSKRFMQAQDRGWIDADGGGQGHSVARFLAAHALAELSHAEPEPALRPEGAWLQSARADYLSHLSHADEDEAADGCRVLFLDRLHHDLEFGIEEIVAAAAPTLADVYRKLTGQDDDPFPEFKALIERRYPGTGADYREARSHTAP